MIETNQQLLSDYALSLKGTVITPYGVAKPKTESEIKAVLDYAQQAKLAVYTVCKGKNWGYSSAQGTSEGQLILDLSNFNQIIEANETLAYATIQAGVTQAEMADFLHQTHSRLQLDVTGAPRDTSLVGNFLERGFGHTDYGNRYESVINLKVLLPNGEIIQTGFGAFQEQFQHKNIFRQGIGPCLEGLFSQSNLGIVLEMTFQLKPRPKYFCMFGLFCQAEEDLPQLVDTLRELRLDNVVNSAVHIANQARAVGKNKNPKMGHWILTGSLSAASKEITNARKKAVKKAFQGKLKQHKLVFFTDKKLKRIEWIHKNIKPIAIIDGLRTTRDLQKGFPTNQPTHTLLSDNNDQLPQFAKDFDDNFLWVNATCNADGQSIKKLKTLVKNFFEMRGHEFRVTFTSITPRTLVMIADIKYARHPAAVKAAQQFYSDCMEMLIANGFYPYRSGSGSYQVYEPFLASAYLDLLHRMKKAIDPTDILAPNKYNMKGIKVDALRLTE